MATNSACVEDPSTENFKNFPDLNDPNPANFVDLWILMTGFKHALITQNNALITLERWNLKDSVKPPLVPVVYKTFFNLPDSGPPPTKLNPLLILMP